MVTKAYRVIPPLVFTYYKKHYCPECGTRLTVIKRSKLIEPYSDEFYYHKLSSGFDVKIGLTKFMWTAFECTLCNRIIEIAEMENIEKKLTEKSEGV